MANISINNTDKQHLLQLIQSYFEQELDRELGQFEAEFLLDFLKDNVGAYFYNQGLYDAQAILSKRLDELTDAIYELEKPL